MSDLRIELVNPKRAKITVSVFPMGNYLTEGKSHKFEFELDDNPTMRKIQNELFLLKANNFNGLANVTIGNKLYRLDSSIWRDLADALFAFIIHLDVASELQALA
jgi:hypothetical protein